MNTQAAVDNDGFTPDRGPVVFAVTTATLALATVFVVARMISRHFIVGRLTWDDKIMALAWLIAFFLSFTIDLGAVNGLGKHDDDIPRSQWVVLRRCEYVFSILYNPALMATKTSIILFLLRLFKDTQFVLRWASYTLLAIVNIAGLILTFMNIFQCSPVQSAWNPYYEGTIKCIPLLTEFICAAPVNIITNLALLALPIPILTGLRLPLRQKTILVITFLLSIFVTVVDVIRISYLQEAISGVPTGSSMNNASRFGGQANFSWNASRSFMWSAVEVNVGIACACIPKLKPLVLKLLPAMLYDPDGSSFPQSSKSRTSDHGQQTTSEIAAPPEAVLPAEDTAGESNDDGGMTAMEFLTAAGQQSSYNRSSVANRNGSAEHAVYFGFVNMAKPKSMIQTSTVESFRYCSVVAILFALWGISYGLLNTLNNVVSAINSMTPAQTLGLTSIYFGGGYFVGPLLVGEWILRRDEHNRSRRHARNQEESIGGFKVCFIVGLCIYGIGTIIFWPSAVTNSFGGYMLSNFVTGVGLSTLETAANAFLILCGPEPYAETRLLLAQGIQGVATVISGVLANNVFFKSISDDNASNSTTLINVQWTYLGITLLCVALALLFYYMPLPEVSDAELEEAAAQLPVSPKKRSLFGLQLRTVVLILAVMAQYFYVGAQESNNIYFRDFVLSLVPSRPDDGDKATQGTTNQSEDDKPPGVYVSIPNYLLIGHTAFALSRFLVGFLTYLSVRYPRLPRPRTYLFLFLTLSFIFSLIMVVLRPSNPNLIVIPAVLFFFAEGPIWPLVFAIGLRGQGRRTKRAAAFITMGASGAAWPIFAQYGVIRTGGSVQTSYIIVVAFQVAMMLYPVFLGGSGDARTLVDLRHHIPANAEPDETSPDTMAADLPRLQTHGLIDEKSPGAIRKATKRLSAKITNSPRRSSHAGFTRHDEDRTDHTSDSTTQAPSPA